MIGLNQGLYYAVLAGAFIGIIWGIKKTIQMEKAILSIDRRLETLLKKVAREEEKIEREIKSQMKVKSVRKAAPKKTVKKAAVKKKTATKKKSTTKKRK